MADEMNNVNRRSFLKNAGVIIGGSAIGAAAMTLRPEMAQAAAAVKAVPQTVTQFRCPVCGKNFGSFAELKNHFRTEHPEHVEPVTTKLNINGEDCEVLIEPHWTLQRTLQFKLGLQGQNTCAIAAHAGHVRLLWTEERFFPVLPLLSSVKERLYRQLKVLRLTPNGDLSSIPTANGTPCSAVTAPRDFSYLQSPCWIKTRIRQKRTAGRHLLETSAAAEPITDIRPRLWKRLRQ